MLVCASDRSGGEYSIIVTLFSDLTNEKCINLKINIKSIGARSRIRTGTTIKA